MRCPHCMQIVKDDLGFCEFCGKAIPAEARATQTSGRKSIFVYLTPILVILAIVLGWYLNTYVIQPCRLQTMSMWEFFSENLNTWDKDNPDKSGVALVQPIDHKTGEYKMRFNFYPAGTMATVESEFAQDECEKLVKTFEDRKDLKKISMTVCVPSKNAEQKTIWEPYMSFDLDRNILSLYDYEDFQQYDLYNVCDNFTLMKEQ